MVLQDFVRQAKRIARQAKRKRSKATTLYQVAVYDGYKWEALPELHHKEALAVSVALAEGRSRQRPVSIRKASGEQSLLLLYWPEGMRTGR